MILRSFRPRQCQYRNNVSSAKPVAIGRADRHVAQMRKNNRNPAMGKDKPPEETKRALDAELDRELEDTFPASDPIKVTRGPARRRITPRLPASKET